MRAAITTAWLGAGTEADPYKPQILPVNGWQDMTGQPTADIAQAKNRYTIEADVTPVQLTAIQADSRFIVLWSREDGEDAVISDLTPAQVTSLKAKLIAVYNADVVRLATDNKVKPLEIANALIAAQVRPPWKTGLTVTAGQVYAYDKNLYQVIQSHTTQAAWTPDISCALWKRFYEPTDSPWPWRQPQGYHDAYPVGAKVTQGGYTWRNDIAANVWQPGVTGWTNLTPPPATVAWAYPVAYKVNDQVTHGGFTYRCLQAHSSQSGWSPPVVPALWLKL